MKFGLKCELYKLNKNSTGSLITPKTMNFLRGITSNNQAKRCSITVRLMCLPHSDRASLISHKGARALSIEVEAVFGVAMKMNLCERLINILDIFSPGKITAALAKKDVSRCHPVHWRNEDLRENSLFKAASAFR